MKSALILAVAAGIFLAAFLWIRPIWGQFGSPEPPDVQGRASRPLPEERAGTGGVIPSPLNPATAANPASAIPGSLAVSFLDDIEAEVFRLTNEARRKQRRSLLEEEQGLHTIARNHSGDMLQRRFFDHVNPDGLSPQDRVAMSHRELIGIIAENVWSGSGYSVLPAQEVADTIIESLMNSPGHRENILNTDLTHMGVGVARADDEIRVTQLFAVVRGLANPPIPHEVKHRDKLILANTGAERYDYWSSDKGLKGTPPLDIGDGTVYAQPGVYKLRFHYPNANGYFIYMGPQITVK